VCNDANSGENWSLFPLQQFHISCHSSKQNPEALGMSSYAGSFIFVTGTERTELVVRAYEWECSPRRILITHRLRTAQSLNLSTDLLTCRVTVTYQLKTCIGQMSWHSLVVQQLLTVWFSGGWRHRARFIVKLSTNILRPASTADTANHCT